ncbi:MAG: hypothetical protein BZY80_02855 [SAR202 cluster bacterium Io17-Chloro-G2]|nr:MAG: hypothetical protein BZY80_02855 [SAR202 cluster bacterium Io17-Chloro-G2]
MAGKSRRVASRQTQLTRRKKRQQRGPSGIPVTEPQPVAVAAATGEDDSAGTLPGAVAQPAESMAAAVPAPSAPSPTRPPSRSRDERPSAYTYTGAELRRIVIMASTGFAVLIALAFAL